MNEFPTTAAADSATHDRAASRAPTAIARAVAVAAAIVATPVAAQTVSYEVADLGSIDGISSTAWRLNDRGEVAGYGSSPALFNEAFRWTPSGGLMTLGAPKGNSASYGVAVNDAGRLAGYGGLASEDSRAFVHLSGPKLDVLPDLAGVESYARDIDNHGRVVGESKASDGQPHAVLWFEGQLTDLGAMLGATNSSAAAISDKGWVVGRADGAPYRLQGGAFALLPTLGSFAVPNDVNDFGDAVGSSAKGVGVGCTLCDTRAVLWRGGGVLDLGVLAPPDAEDMASSALGINNLGQVVGWSTTHPLGSHHGFVWDPIDGMLDLNDLVPDGWNIVWATDINDAGEISAFGSFGAFAPQRALLLTPLEDTPVLINPQPGTAGATNRFEVLHAAPGGSVALFAGFGFQDIALPLCGQKLALGSPLFLGVLPTDATGRVHWDFAVPPAVSGVEVVFQAFDLTACRVTAVSVQTF